MSENVIDALRAALGEQAVLQGEALEPRYRKAYFAAEPEAVQPLAVVRPRCVDEVATVLRLCHQFRQPLVTQGGMTGLSGGALPNTGELILSLALLRGIEEIDEMAGTMTLLAGTPLQEAQEAAAARGFMVAIDLGARGTCQIGGNLATNAGGNRVIRYGMAKQQALGLEAVLADGTVISSLNKMLKNNAGYDLKQLFLGSEGTLGVITRAVLKLEPLPNCVQTAFCAVDSYAKVVGLLRHAQRRLSGRLSAFETLWADYYEFVTRRLPGQREPLPSGSPFYVLLDLQGSDGERDGELFGLMLEEALAEGLISDAVIASSEKETQSLWKLRDAPGEFPSVWPGLVSFDVSLPIGSIGPFVEALAPLFDTRFPGCEYVHFGHVGDSNLHVCIATPQLPAADLPEQAIKDCLYDLLRDFGGCVSAEHGIGSYKTEYLAHSRSPAEIALMRTLKLALDPHQLLNPGRVLGVDAVQSPAL